MELSPHAQRLQHAIRWLNSDPHPLANVNSDRVVGLLSAWLQHELATLVIETQRLVVDYGIEPELAETYVSDAPLAMLALNMAEAVLDESK